MCTEIYEQRFKGEGEKGKGLGAKWEGAVIIQELYDAESINDIFIPLVFTPQDRAHIPAVLRGATCYELYTEEGYEKLYRHITNQPDVLKPELGHLRPMPPRERKQDFTPTKTYTKGDHASLGAMVDQELSDSRQSRSRSKREKYKAIGYWVFGIIGVIAVFIFILWLMPEKISPEGPITKLSLTPLPQLKTQSRVNEVALSEAGELAASAEESGTIHAWRVRSGDQPGGLEKSGKPIAARCVAIGPDGNMIAAGSADGQVRLWQSITDPAPKVVESHTDSVYQVYFSPDGQRLASSGVDREGAKSVRIWSIADRINPLTEFNIPDSDDKILTVSSDLQFVAIFSSRNRRIEIWSLTHNRRETALADSNLVLEGGGAFSQDGKLFTAGSNWRVVRLWQTTDGKHLKDLEGPRDSVSSIAFHPDGRIIAAGYRDGSISVWDIDSDEPPLILKEHGGEVFTVAFSRSGTVVSSGGGDGKIQLWEIVE